VIIGNNTNISWNFDRYDIYKQYWMVATTITKYKLKNCWRTENNTRTKRISAKLTSFVAWLKSYFDNSVIKCPPKINIIYFASYSGVISWKN
jgi:hypothetical protein